MTGSNIVLRPTVSSVRLCQFSMMASVRARVTRNCWSVPSAPRERVSTAAVYVILYAGECVMLVGIILYVLLQISRLLQAA